MNRKIEKEIKKSLINAYSDLTPDRLSKINKVQVKKVDTMKEVIGERKCRNFPMAPAFATAAVAAVLAVAVLFRTGHEADSQYAYIYIDVNPSIEITVNSQGDVVSCKACNYDGEEIVGAKAVMDSVKKKEKLNIVIENVIKSIKEKGYFSGQYDSVLVSCANAAVLGKSDIKAMISEVESYVKEKNVCNNIVYAEVADYEAAKQKARKYGISPGKANYVEKIAMEVVYTEEELATQNIDSIVDLEIETVTVDETTCVYTAETASTQNIGETEVTTKNLIIETEKSPETERVTVAETSSRTTETSETKMLETTTKAEETTVSQNETTSFQTPVKTVIKLKDKEYESGVLQVTFKKRVEWSENGIVRVTSSSGSIMDAEFSNQNSQNCVVKIKGCVPGETYTVYFEGIKRKNAINYTNYTFTFTVVE